MGGESEGGRVGVIGGMRWKCDGRDQVWNCDGKDEVEVMGGVRWK